MSEDEEASTATGTSGGLDDNNNNNNDHPLEATYNRIKANGFFLMGTILYLPPNFADVIAIPNDPTVEFSMYVNADKAWYFLMLLTGMFFYFANGIFETKTALRRYRNEEANQAVLQQQQADGDNDPDSIVIYTPPHRGAIINGCLFTTAAFLALLSNAFWYLTFLTFSNLCYLSNALLTLWLRRRDANNAGHPLILPDQLVRFGDLLFLLGTTLDVSTTYMEWKAQLDDSTMETIVRMKLISALAWFADAILYLIADKIILDTHHEETSKRSSMAAANAAALASGGGDAGGDGDDKGEGKTGLSPLV